MVDEGQDPWSQRKLWGWSHTNVLGAAPTGLRGDRHGYIKSMVTNLRLHALKPGSEVGTTEFTNIFNIPVETYCPLVQTRYQSIPTSSVPIWLPTTSRLSAITSLTSFATKLPFVSEYRTISWLRSSEWTNIRYLLQKIRGWSSSQDKPWILQ